MKHRVYSGIVIDYRIIICITTVNELCPPPCISNSMAGTLSGTVRSTGFYSVILGNLGVPWMGPRSNSGFAETGLSAVREAGPAGRKLCLQRLQMSGV